MAMIEASLIEQENARRAPFLDADYAALAEQLSRSGLDIDTVTAKVSGYGVAIPSWGVGTGGTRFARFPARANPEMFLTSLTIARSSTS